MDGMILIYLILVSTKAAFEIYGKMNKSGPPWALPPHPSPLLPQCEFASDNKWFCITIGEPPFLFPFQSRPLFWNDYLAKGIRLEEGNRLALHSEPGTELG